MTCEEAHRLMAELAEKGRGQAPAELQAHLESCRDCALDAWVMLSLAGSPDARAGELTEDAARRVAREAVARVRQADPAAEARQRRESRRWTRIAIAVITAHAVACGLFVSLVTPVLIERATALLHSLLGAGGR